ncbi:ATP-binding protein [Frigoribacterium sp. SL97]|uniref:ATP-binding protein n=1 Tax=Frigoribacterium sp. SL97 TaxID=2994664 RepID=UPI00226E78A9|nr:ATP-binding protein [Frigoribacterium sp. SL97]WAC53417.1 ATP-binding protein [Frigoribacterium sp. SL97]
MTVQSVESFFRPRARLLQLLGDQLIGSARLAIFELVKNSYDADASEAIVTMSGLRSDSPQIEVRDDGSGMSLATLRDIWLVPGHDHKALDRAFGRRSPGGRLPLGEKGVGRFAVHKLGARVEVVSKRAGHAECIMSIDWDVIADSEFLDEAEVTIRERPSEVFVGDGETGTVVTVASLKGDEWTRGEIRKLYRQITSISSPFTERTDKFTAQLRLPDEHQWLDEMPNTATLLESAPWKFTFTLDGNQFTWEFSFLGFSGVSLEPRTVAGSDYGVLLDPKDLPERDQARLGVDGAKLPKVSRSSSVNQTGIGPISGTFYVFDRDRDVLAKIGHSASVQEFLNESGGVRVYRDGIRVYNYGEPGDDWLGLDIRRVNAPSKRISNNIIVAAVDLSLAESYRLAEKTNREGFVEGPSLSRLRAFIRGALAVLEAERNKDKTNLRRLLGKQRSSLKGGIERPLKQIRTLAKKNSLSDQIDPLIDRAQKAYDDMREIMLRSGISGMSLVIVYHEIDHGVRLLHKALRAGSDVEKAVEQARDLVGVLDSFGDLLRRGESREQDLRKLAERAAALNSVRFQQHGIDFAIDIDRGSESEPVMSFFPFGLVLGALTNLIDNSIYWLGARWPDAVSSGSKRLLLRVDIDSFAGPAIVIADNGPGFSDSFGDSLEPFFTRRPDGIGVGLYYVNLIMNTIGGQLLEGVDLAGVDVNKYGGAALVLVFPRGK